MTLFLHFCRLFGVKEVMRLTFFLPIRFILTSTRFERNQAPSGIPTRVMDLDLATSLESWCLSHALFGLEALNQLRLVILTCAKLPTDSRARSPQARWLSQIVPTRIPLAPSGTLLTHPGPSCSNDVRELVTKTSTRVSRTSAF